MAIDLGLIQKSKAKLITNYKIACKWQTSGKKNFFSLKNIGSLNVKARLNAGAK